MIRVFAAAVLTVLVCAAFAASLIPAFRATDFDRHYDNLALAVFGWIAYVLGGVAVLIFALVLIWGRVSGISFDDGGNVDDVRCQRYESYFNGKTTTYEWRTIACVEVGR